jgi:tRNA-(ms[2]io[6]A)-hydroxylase
MNTASSFESSTAARATARALTVVPLRVRTSESWQRAALHDLPTLLEDHCQCELKAASNALALIGRNPGKNALVERMQRLAREELQHFQLLRETLASHGIEPRKPQRSPYMSGLHAMHRDPTPALLDALLISALVEARSCERFAALTQGLARETAPNSRDRGVASSTQSLDSPAVPGPESEHLAQMYGNLARSESGHAATFLELAKLYFAPQLVEEELTRRLHLEAALLAEIPLSARMHGGNGPQTA